MAQLRKRPRKPYAFTKFGSLPTELRLMIWREAATTARLVIFDPQPKKSALHSVHLPPLLYVNSESRYVASKHYTLRFTIEFEFFPALRPTRTPVLWGHRKSIIMSPHDVLAFYGVYKFLRRNPRLVRISGVKAADGWSSNIKRAAVLGNRIWDNKPLVPFLTCGSVDLDLGFRTKPERSDVGSRPPDRLTVENWVDEGDERDYNHLEDESEDDQQVVKSAFVDCKRAQFQEWARAFLSSSSRHINGKPWQMYNPYHIWAFELAD